MKLCVKVARSYITKYKSRSVSILLSMIICISLIVGISSLFESEKQANIEMLKYENSSYHVEFKDVSNVNKNKILEDSTVSKVGIRRYYDSGADPNQMFNIVEANQDYLDLENTKIIKGRLPSKPGEIAIEPWVAQNLGIAEKIDQKISFKLYNNGNEKTEDFTVVGIIKDVVVNKSRAIKEIITSYDEKSNKEQYIYIGFKESKHLDENINRLKKELKVKNDNFKINKDVVSAESSNIFINSYLGSVVIIIALFGCFIVYSIYNISTMQRISEYGMLKAIGTNKGKLFNIIFMELLTLFAVAVPLGVVTGILGAKLTASHIGVLNPESIGVISKVFISNESIAISIILLFIEVFIISILNLIKLNRLSTIDAISKNLEKDKKNKSKKMYSFGRRLYVANFISLKNMTNSKKSFAVAVASMSLGSIIFIVSNFVFYIKNESNKLKLTEYNIISSDYYISESSTDLSDGINEEQVKKIKNLDGIKSVEPFKYRLISMNIDMDKMNYPDFYEDYNLAPAYKAMGGIFNKNKDNKSYDFKGGLFGYNDLSLKRLKPFLKEGSIDIENMKNNNVVIIKLDYDGKGNKAINYKVGDKIKIKFQRNTVIPDEDRKFPDGKEYIEKEYVIGGIVDQVIVDEWYIGATYGCKVIISNDKFKEDIEKNTGNSNYRLVNIQQKDNYNHKKLNKKIHKIINGTTGVVMQDLVEETNNIDKLYKQKLIFINTVIVILFLVSLFNIANNLSYNLTARTKEFGNLRAIGLSSKKFRNMIIFEGITYGVVSDCITVIASIALQVYMFGKMKSELMDPKFFIDYKLYIEILVLNILIGLVATYVPFYKMKSKNIIEMTA
ncbi:MAG: ABC transporter permease, partial [Clostridioides sp.]|nr:ABC transporter permease [Clostridioides sp.]